MTVLMFGTSRYCTTNSSLWIRSKYERKKNVAAGTRKDLPTQRTYHNMYSTLTKRRQNITTQMNLWTGVTRVEKGS